MAVNGQDAPTGGTFTLMHELVQVALRQGGICTPLVGIGGTPTEVFCNAVAGATLVPRDALFAHPGVSASSSVTDAVVAQAASTFRTSREVIWRRLLTLGRISQSVYRETRAELHASAVAKARSTGHGPPPAVLAVSDLDRPLVRPVVEGYHQEILTGSDVADYLGVRWKHIPQQKK